jgi:lactate permease
VLVCGGSFAIVQFLWSNFVGPGLVDIIGGLVSLACTAMFCARWRPAVSWDFHQAQSGPQGRPQTAVPVSPSVVPAASGSAVRAWMPWVFLSVFVTLWGAGPFKALLTGGPAGARTYWETGRPPAPHAVLSPAFDVPGLHRAVFREHPVEPDPVNRALINDPAYRTKRAEAARFSLNWLSATGTAILFSAIVTALYLRIPAATVLQVAGMTFL